ncbi:MAG TPA: hypothetical protein VNK05_14570 [Chloroflexota bacterium]|nr:hypothetical protein [Chloroflexota bacterium]
MPTGTAAAATATRTPVAAASTTGAARPLGAAASGYFLFRGPEALYLPLAALGGVAAAAGPSAATVSPPPAAGPPAGAAPLRAPVGAAVPLTPGVPQPIATLWPDLPAAFQQGVRGAADVDGVLYLFAGGRYVRADGAIPPANLTDVAGWPQTDTWKDGVVDLVGSGRGDGQVLLVRGDEYLVLDLAQPAARVAAGPAPLSATFGGAFLAALQAPGGAEAVLFGASVASAAAPWVLQGPAVSGFDHAGAGSALRWRQYVATHFAPSWPVLWNPSLSHAPSGRVGDLWAPAAGGGRILHHDGAAWTPTPGAATSVAAGGDGSAWCVGVDLAQHNVYRWNPVTSVWDTVLQFGPTLTQISAGDASQVWLRDSDNSVYRLQEGQGGQGARLAPVPQAGSPVHLAANADGSLWTCDGSRPAAVRLIAVAGGQTDAIDVQAAGPVLKVASTGFGASHILVGQGEQAQLYRYDSPYVFMTGQSYAPAGSDPLEQGLGNVYLPTSVRIGDPIGPDGYYEYQVVALDAHTGQEVSRSATAPTGMAYTGPVFDPLHEVVIVGLVGAPGLGPRPGAMLGLDARDLTRVRWSFTPLGPDGAAMIVGGRPVLRGTSLCFTDNRATITMYDTGTAPGDAPSHRWWHSLPTIPSGQYRLPPPVLSGGQVYATWWTYETISDQQQLGLVALDAATGAAPAAFTFIDRATMRPHYANFSILGDQPPVLAQVVDGGQPRPVLFASGGNVVWRIDVEAPNSAQTFSWALPGRDNQIMSGLAFGAGGLWFGDFGGTLYGLSASLETLPNTPALLDTAGQRTGQIRTTPVVYETGLLPVLPGAASGAAAAEGAVVFVGVFASNRPPSLLTFDPSNGNVFATPTGATWLTNLSASVADGVLYAAGAASGSGPIGVTIPIQVFGVRVDEVVQGLRDFVVESVLMQDFDPAPAGQPLPANPQGSARYQTHLTVLDDSKAPRPMTPVKIWADRPTWILLNGQLAGVGPGDADYAAAQSGADGVVTIVSGDVAGAVPGQGPAPVSAPADFAAAPLRVWAPFMDPYERLVVFPDREFHNRLATTHATPAGQAGADDPTRVNLQTAQSYGPPQRGGASSGPPLFTPGEQNQQQPQQVAQAIQTMTGAIGDASLAALLPAAAGQRTVRGRARAGADWVRTTTDTPGAAGKYLAYDDLPGARYAAVNTPSARAAAVIRPVGLTYSRDDAGDNPPAFSRLTPAAAATRIDALGGTPWEQSPHAPAHVRAAARGGAVRGVGAGLGSWWSDFWDWLKRAAAKITHFLVSVAEEIYVGIRLIVAGVVYVFRQVVHALEEVAHAIGAFFVALAKAIAKVLEALSVLFHFGEILKTQQFVQGELLKRVNGVPNDPRYPGFAAAIRDSAKGPLDAFFVRGEQAIAGALNGLADRIAGESPGDVPLDGLKGGGATAHTAFTVAPKGGGPPASHAPQSTWAMHKLTAGLGPGGGAGAPSVATAGTGAGTESPVAAFVDGIVHRLTTDPVLGDQRAKLAAGFARMGHASSAGDFLRQGVAELLRAVALLVEGALAVANAVADGFLDLVSDLLSTLLDPQTGLLLQPIEIPVLSWLFQALLGEPLTVLNLITLVAAIPVTVLWRVLKGQWPSQSLGPGAGVSAAVSAVVSEVMGFFAGVGAILVGVLAALADGAGLWRTPNYEGELDKIKQSIALVLVGLSLVNSAVTFPLLGSGQPSGLTWAAWAVALVIPPVAVIGVPGIFFAANGISAETQELLPRLIPWIVCALSTAVFALAFSDLVLHPGHNVAQDLSFCANAFAPIPGVSSPVGLTGEAGEFVLAGLDLIIGLGVGVLFIVAATESSGAALFSPAAPARPPAAPF